MSPLNERGSKAWQATVWLARCAVAVKIALVSRAVIGLGHSLVPWLRGFVDDFFYYAVIADHVVREGRLTFDGTVETNGFHPLYMLVVVLARWVTGGLSARFFQVILVVGLLGSYVTFELLLRVGVVRCGRALFVPVMAAVLASHTVTLTAHTGMEVGLVVPAMAYFVLQCAELRAGPEALTPRTALALGGTMSAVVLLRVDALILCAPVLVLLVRQARRGRRVWAAFALGTLPLAAYFAVNVVHFGGLFPVSSDAKALRASLLPSTSGILLSQLDRGELLYLATTWLAAAFIVRDVIRREKWTADELVQAILPTVYIVALWWRSSWSMPPWYFYAFVVPCFSSGLTIATRITKPLPGRAVEIAALVTVAGMIAMGALDFATPPDLGDLSMDDHAVHMAPFAASHPGKYAMGDRAGKMAFRIGRPLLQLEGLVEDRRFLEHIRHDEALVNVLRDYQVDYLIVSGVGTLTKVSDGYQVCAPTPDQAGARSHMMKGTLTSEPVFEYQDAIAATYVFDLSREDRR